MASDLNHKRAAEMEFQQASARILRQDASEGLNWVMRSPSQLTYRNFRQMWGQSPAGCHAHAGTGLLFRFYRQICSAIKKGARSTNLMENVGEPAGL